MIAGQTEPLPDIKIRVADFGDLARYKEVSFVIPWMDNGNPLRARNLKFVLQNLKNLSACHVILASQGGFPEELPVDESFMEVIQIEKTSDLIEKSKLINLAVKVARPWFFQVDADLVFDYSDTLRKALKDSLNLPYKQFQMLTEAETLRLIGTGSLVVKQVLKRQNRAPVAGGFLMRSSLMRGRLAFDERLKGWSAEDIAFHELVRSRHPVIRLDLGAVHLNHGNDRVSV